MFSKLGPTTWEHSAIKNSSIFTESLKNLGWKGLLEVNSSKHLFKAGLTSGLNQVHTDLASQILKIPKNGDSTTFLENFLQCLITSSTKNFLLMSNWNFPCCNLTYILTFCSHLRRVCLLHSCL